MVIIISSTTTAVVAWQHKQLQTVSYLTFSVGMISPNNFCDIL